MYSYEAVKQRIMAENDVSEQEELPFRLRFPDATPVLVKKIEDGKRSGQVKNTGGLDVSDNPIQLTIYSKVSQSGWLMSRRGRSWPADASGLDTHRDSISSRFDCRTSSTPSSWTCRAS
eukprot:COSAG02_NODE_25857_length_647_cov_0.899635_1_plen_118_part_10